MIYDYIKYHEKSNLFFSPELSRLIFNKQGFEIVKYDFLKSNIFSIGILSLI